LPCNHAGKSIIRKSATFDDSNLHFLWCDNKDQGCSEIIGVGTITGFSPTQKTEFGDLVVFNPEPHQSFPSGQTFVSYRMDFTELRLPPFLCSQVQLNKAIQEQRLAKYLNRIAIFT
jgi:hypothetical protein